MKGKVIVRDKNLSGCFVAMATFNNNSVIAHGKSPSKVRQDAIKQGFLNPVVVFVPKKNSINLY